MLIKTATTITGGTSSPGKMPGDSWGISARACNIGSQLARIPGTVCHECYALTGRYRMPVVQAAQDRRLRALHHPQWIPAMARLAKRNAHFRWFDSGDLQSESNLDQIVQVAILTPETHHWLPTREVGIVAQYRRTHTIPSNLIIRISGNWIDGEPPRTDLPGSIVSRHRDYPDAHECPAKFQGNKCLDCRACWQSNVDLIMYHAD